MSVLNFKSFAIGVAVFLGVLSLVGCGSTGGGSGSGGGSSSAGASAGGPDVLDLTWGTTRGGYGTARGRTRDRYEEVVQQVRRYDKDYYVRQVRTVDAQGAPLRPIEQVKFKQNVRPNVKPKSVSLKPKKMANDTTFLDSDGNPRKFSSFRGKPLVLVFTRGFPGYICPMCTSYTAQITVNYSKIQALGAEVAIVFPGSEDEVDDFVNAAQDIAETDDDIPFPILLDPRLLAVSRFGIEADLARPSTYIFDSQGEMQWGYVGDQPHDRPDVATILKELAKIK
ncbi:MAG: redoxin domain-containing protein [Planctomycetota bacterium]